MISSYSGYFVRVLPILLLACAPTAPIGVSTPHDTGPADSGTQVSSDDSGLTEDPRCPVLEPSGTPYVDRSSIEDCLAKGPTTLGVGTFVLDRALGLPIGGTLTGSGELETTLQLGEDAAGASALIQIQGEGEVANLRLDGNDQLQSLYRNAVIVITGSDNRVHDCWIGDGAPGEDAPEDQGIYFVDPDSTANLVTDVEIEGTWEGVVFGRGLAPGSANRVEDSLLHDLRCAGARFSGYGELADSVIKEVGGGCTGGVGVWVTDQEHGALVEGNQISMTCGHGVFLDGAQAAIIQENHIFGSGQATGGIDCGGAAGIALLDSARNTVVGNQVEVEDASWNAGVDPEGLFHASGAEPFSDLPDGSDTVIAFWLAQRPGKGGAAVGNTVQGNHLLATCSADCVGLAYFFGRGTGLEAGSVEGSDSSNLVETNDPLGSDRGSVRCGHNRYAPGVECPGSESCNADDPEHGVTADRNDDCLDY